MHIITGKLKIVVANTEFQYENNMAYVQLVNDWLLPAEKFEYIRAARIERINPELICIGNGM